MDKVFTTELAVYIGDINYGGHLGHDRLITLLHQARLDFLQQLGANELDCFGCGLIMRRLQVDYLAEAFLRDVLHVEMRVTQLKQARFNLTYRIRRGETLIARAETLMVAFDYRSRQVCALPEAFVQALSEEAHG